MVSERIFRYIRHVVRADVAQTNRKRNAHAIKERAREAIANLFLSRDRVDFNCLDDDCDLSSLAYNVWGSSSGKDDIYEEARTVTFVAQVPEEKFASVLGNFVNIQSRETPCILMD